MDPSPAPGNKPRSERESVGVFERIVHFFQFIADEAPVRSRRAALLVILLVAALLGLTASVVFLTDGTGNAFLHLAYLPVIIASLALGLQGGIITALIAGLLVLGPFMPLVVSENISQNWSNVLYRTFFLLLVALATGSFGASIRIRRAAAEASQERLERLYARNLRLFASLVSTRDRETADHCERVAHNCVVLGRRLGLSAEELNNLYWAGMLHDLGKLAVPEAILQKPAALTDEEFEVVKQHSKIGADILVSLSVEFQPIAEGVHWHHEKWDGSGYPDGLKGEEIPLAARVLAVVDVYEAVTTDRPYHHAISSDAAIDLITAGSGTHFDPEVASVFREMVQEGQLVSADQAVSGTYDSFYVSLTRN